MYQLGELGPVITDFIPSRPKFSDQKTFVSDFFKVPKKLFVSQKKNLEDTLIFGECIQHVPKSTIDLFLNSDSFFFLIGIHSM